MRILVTGSAGFLGKHIVEALPEHEVLGLDAKTGTDILGGKFLQRVVDFQPEVLVANAARVGGISTINKLPFSILAENEEITLNTFEAAVACFLHGFLKKIVAISSSMVYENFPWTHTYTEEDLPNIPPPTSTYGFQKLALEYYCLAAQQEYDLPYVILRPFNLIGKEDTSNHVIPDLIRKVRVGGPVSLMGGGTQIRCFTHVRDVASAVALACTKEVVNEDFNIANPRPITILALAEMIWKKLRSDPFTWVKEPGEAIDVQRRFPAVDKAQRLLGWKATISLEDALEEICADLT